MRSSFSLRLFALLAGIALLASISVLVTGSAASADTCAVTWGSLAEDSATMTTAPLTNVRAGHHACFDRLVFDISGTGAGYHAEYVPVVYSEGAGDPLPVRGDADLQFTVRAPAYNDQGQATYTPATPKQVVNVTGFPTIKQVRWGGSFEGQTTFAVGIRARLPFRVMTLAGPGGGSRVVLDVAHHW
jgi:hypothetical protein